jgi:thymidylate synthase (FAD)
MPKFIDPAVILEHVSHPQPIKFLEMCGRVCYKSEDKITDESSVNFVKSIVKSGHHSVLEHVSATARIICDRGVSHEIVRHRIASYSQESTRYCNYGNDKFGGVSFIRPFWIPVPEEGKSKDVWYFHMDYFEKAYLDALSK